MIVHQRILSRRFVVLAHVFVVALASVFLGGKPADCRAGERWTAERANQWYATQPWLVGCNFIPSTAINQLEMWQADSFDPQTIDRELGWAAELGFTSVRVYLHNLLWDQDREGFLRRVEQFLAIADKHGIGAMMVPLDGVWDPQPKLGPQRAPRPHVHNSGWVQAPGAAILGDPDRHEELKPYIQGLIRHFRQDRRIQVWDLFNEPDNPNRNSYGQDGAQTELAEEIKETMATRLLEKLFVWAREADPMQPLTAGVWRGDCSDPEQLTPYNRVMLEQSDVISFHCYGPLAQMQRMVEQLRRYGRPLLCTEYMSRGSGSTFDPVLGYLKQQSIAAYNWGLVDGKTQTIYPWETWQKQFTARPEPWFHDIFHADGTPYRREETQYIQRLTRVEKRVEKRPNILFAVSDDQSYPHASAYGYRAIRTPAFDRVARTGVLFRNAFTPAPGCSPMRAAMLTGRNIWQIEHAGTHASSFSTKYEVYQDRLEAAGYHVGYTGKGWSPGDWKISGRERNPAGPAYAKRKMESPPGISGNDYAANFADFLKARPAGQPFSFWYGATEPHRGFQRGIGRQQGLDPALVEVPPFLPDVPEVRDDLLDYCFEIQWFDRHLERMLDLLEEAGELDNTLVIVTSDNGMAFPRAKANLYEYGIHMPLAIAWPSRVPGGRVSEDLVNLIDVTATIYEATGVSPPDIAGIAGASLLDLLASQEDGIIQPERDTVFAARERHSSSRFNSLGYPQRCIRTHKYLYIRNLRSERWPAGAPQRFNRVVYDDQGQVVESTLSDEHSGYPDIDPCPTLTLLVERREDPEIAKFLHMAVDRRPAEELFDIRNDPGCLTNLADRESHAEVKQQLSERLMAYLRQTGDVRVTDPEGGEVWETYPRYSPLRWFPQPEWAREHPDRVPWQPWLEERRPRARE